MRNLLVLAACSFMAVGCFKVPPPLPPVKLVDASEMTWIIEKVMARWENEEGRRLKLEHSEIRYQGNNFALRLELSSQEILEMCEARFLAADFVEDLLREINTNPIVGCQLACYPMTAEQLKIDINFESYFGKYIDPYYIGYIEMKGGMVYYYAFDQKDRERYSWHARVEPYWKTRELAAIMRATRKQYDDAHRCILPDVLPEKFDLPELGPECQYKRHF